MRKYQFIFLQRSKELNLHFLIKILTLKSQQIKRYRKNSHKAKKFLLNDNKYF